MNLQKKLPKRSTTAVSSPHGKLLAIVGPTAAGKTGVALSLAGQYPIEIICADSRTIYRGMDIGTAKPTLKEQAQVPHWGLDLVKPGESYSAAQFVIYAEQKIQEIWARGNAAVIVGGSGMYIDALLFGYKFRNATSQKQDFSLMPYDELVTLAQNQYPAEIKHIDVKNTRRLVQLLERGPVNSADRDDLKYQAKIIGIDPPKGNLQIRIDKRTDQMLKQGFVQECELLVNTYGNSCRALQTTGYSAVVGYLRGAMSYEDMRQRIVIDTRRLAKKQRTWFHRNSHIEWAADEEEALAIANSYLQA